MIMYKMYFLRRNITFNAKNRLSGGYARRAERVILYSYKIMYTYNSELYNGYKTYNMTTIIALLWFNLL